MRLIHHNADHVWTHAIWTPPSSLFTPSPTPPQQEGSEGRSRERGAQSDSKQGRTRTHQDSFIFLHGGLDTCSMYEKLTMLNLQSGSNWSGPNNWYHDPTGVQTQHSTGERKSFSVTEKLVCVSSNRSVILKRDSSVILTLYHFFCHLHLRQCLRAVYWTRRAAWVERRGEEARAEGEESPWKGTTARSHSWGCSSRGSCRGTGPASHRSRSRHWRKVRPCKHAQRSPPCQPITALHGHEPEQRMLWRSLYCCFSSLANTFVIGL